MSQEGVQLRSWSPLNMTNEVLGSGSMLIPYVVGMEMATLLSSIMHTLDALMVAGEVSLGSMPGLHMFTLAGMLLIPHLLLFWNVCVFLIRLQPRFLLRRSV